MAKTRSRREPAVQAAYMKDLLAELGRRRPQLDLRRRDPELVEQVEGASRVAWLPVEWNVRVVDAVVSELGEESGLECLAECVHAQFDNPLWKGFFVGAIRLLGREPGSLGRWIPHALKLVFRNCGVFSAETIDQGSLRIRAEELPAPLAAHRVWLRSLGIGMHTLFLVCGSEGKADLADHDSEARTATILLTWKAKQP